MPTPSSARTARPASPRRLEPATIDGLVYASSMVNLYAARHRLPVPALARWLLALGITATLAANMAQGWSRRPAGAVIAAWPAVSPGGQLRTAGLDHRYRGGRQPGPRASSGPHTLVRGSSRSRVPGCPPPAAAPDTHLARIGLVPVSGDGPFLARAPGADQESRPGQGTAPDRADQVRAGSGHAGTAPDESQTSAAAVAAHRASLQTGRPLSERKLAAMFGKTLRRWARRRIAEARQSLTPA
jgi:hypothetical protein